MREPIAETTRAKAKPQQAVKVSSWGNNAQTSQYKVLVKQQMQTAIKGFWRRAELSRKIKAVKFLKMIKMPVPLEETGAIDFLKTSQAIDEVQTLKDSEEDSFSRSGS